MRWAFFRGKHEAKVDLWPFEKHYRRASVVASPARRREDTSHMGVLPEGPTGKGNSPDTPRQSDSNRQGGLLHVGVATRTLEKKSWWNVQAQGNERAFRVASSFPLPEVGKSARGEAAGDHRDQTMATRAFTSF